MFSEDGQGLCCPEKAGSTIWVPGQRRAWTGLSGSCPPIGVGEPRDLRWQNGVLGVGV
jgi:hypothetical protein